MDDKNIRNFDDDLISSNNPKLRESWERIFKLKFGNDCEIFWKDDLNVQKGLGIDTTIKTKQGRRYSIEIKTRKKSCFGKDWIMEIVHQHYDKEDKETRKHLGKKEGWIYTTTADYIFHGTLNSDGTDLIEVIFYSLYPFKNEVWKSEFEKYPNFWWKTQFTDKFQLTLNKEIPKEVIKEDALEFWEWTK